MSSSQSCVLRAIWSLQFAADTSSGDQSFLSKFHNHIVRHFSHNMNPRGSYSGSSIVLNTTPFAIKTHWRHHMSTRLVDIRRPCYIEFSTQGPWPAIRRYVALSYCWDSSMPESGRMILSSLAAYQRQIKGTIKVTRSSSTHFIFFYTQCPLSEQVCSQRRPRKQGWSKLVLPELL
jgi:hypothetical protein